MASLSIKHAFVLIIQQRGSRHLKEPNCFWTPESSSIKKEMRLESRMPKPSQDYKPPLSTAYAVAETGRRSGGKHKKPWPVSIPAARSTARTPSLPRAGVVVGPYRARLLQGGEKVKLLCLLFGHKAHSPAYSIEVCERCGSADDYYGSGEQWADFERVGLLGYPRDYWYRKTFHLRERCAWRCWQCNKRLWFTRHADCFCSVECQDQWIPF